jgi:hypothetical protein
MPTQPYHTPLSIISKSVFHQQWRRGCNMRAFSSPLFLLPLQSRCQKEIVYWKIFTIKVKVLYFVVQSTFCHIRLDTSILNTARKVDRITTGNISETHRKKLTFKMCLYCIQTQKVSELTIKFANSPPCACRGSTGQTVNQAYYL